MTAHGFPRSGKADGYNAGNGVVQKLLSVVGSEGLSYDEAHTLLKRSSYNLQRALNVYYEEGAGGLKRERSDSSREFGSEDSIPLCKDFEQDRLGNDNLKPSYGAPDSRIGQYDVKLKEAFHNWKSSSNVVENTGNLRSDAKKRKGELFVSVLESNRNSLGAVSSNVSNVNFWPRELCKFACMIESTINCEPEELKELLRRESEFQVVAQDNSKKSFTEISKKKNVKALMKMSSKEKSFLQSNAKSRGSTIVRVCTVQKSSSGRVQHRFFGRLKKPLASLTYFLLNCEYIRIKAQLQFDFFPEKLSVFTAIPAILTVQLLDESIFSLFNQSFDALSPHQHMVVNHLFALVKTLLLDDKEDSIEKIEDDMEQMQKEESPCHTLSEEGLDQLAETTQTSSSENHWDKSVTGLSVDLLPHQHSALAWMVGRESGLQQSHFMRDSVWQTVQFNSPPNTLLYINVYSRKLSLTEPGEMKALRGGILADDMGMGKTITVLALLGNELKPGSAQRMELKKTFRTSDGSQNVKAKSTLIVCPLSLIGQWTKEIESKFQSGRKPTIYLYYGNCRGRKTDFDSFLHHDVTVTTYGVLVSEFKNHSRCSLFGVKWHRVVLDECHCIKNHTTDVSKAAAALDSERRWCLTGTPVQNSVDDLFSLIRFLRFEPWNWYPWWLKVVKKPLEQEENVEESSAAMRRLRALLTDGPLMLRRAKRELDQAFKASKSELPPIYSEMVKLKLSCDERNFYNELFKQTRSKVNDIFAQGVASARYATILTLLLRLRQACDHPLLLLSSFGLDDSLKGEIDIESLSEVKIRLLKRFRSEPGDSKQQLSSAVLRVLKSKDLSAECPICLGTQLAPVVTVCGHSFCYPCLVETLDAHGNNCPTCRTPIDGEEDIFRVERTSSGNSDTKKSDFELAVHSHNLSKGMLFPSTKIAYLLKKVEEIRALNKALKEGCDVLNQDIESYFGPGASISKKTAPIKVLIFSQWTSVLDIIGRLLSDSGVPFTRLDGSMSRHQRELCIQEFNESNETNVFVLSLTAGGTGLNLSSASVVFIVDIWWNEHVEEQAMSRAHRYGQTRPVHVFRLVASDTVEERILDIQNRKRRISNAAYGDKGDDMFDSAVFDNEGGLNTKLTLDDFLYLFQ